MLYEFMFTQEHEDAKSKNLPLVIPVGNLEYHGSHTVCGMDIIIANGIAKLLERQTKIVLAPVFAYAPSSYAASGPKQGTISLDIDIFHKYIKGVLRAFIEGGWNNIYILIHHQYNIKMLFPMTLACLLAGKQIFFEMMEQRDGRGWFSRADDIDMVTGEMNLVKVLPVMSREVQRQTGCGHAGRAECSLLAALMPERELVKLKRAGRGEWFAETAIDYSAEYGREIIKKCIEDLKKKII